MNLNKQEYQIKLEIENLRMQFEIRNTYQNEIKRMKEILKNLGRDVT